MTVKVGPSARSCKAPPVAKDTGKAKDSIRVHESESIILWYDLKTAPSLTILICTGDKPAELLEELDKLWLLDDDEFELLLEDEDRLLLEDESLNELDDEEELMELDDEDDENELDDEDSESLNELDDEEENELELEKELEE